MKILARGALNKKPWTVGLHKVFGPPHVEKIKAARRRSFEEARY